ncbi:MAG: MarR family winged helix-turn-helix transcriptional regulator [Phycisphaerae bacterium]|jgi:DNA-binding MarR family transcriptional regulator
MPRGNSEQKPARQSPSAGHAAVGDPRVQLLRHLHIFSSIVREILEVGPLRDASGISLTPSQFQFLKAITLNGGHQVGEVAGLLGLSPPAATKSINKLEALGLIVRSPSKGDRRATLLSPSPKGRRLVRVYEGRKVDRLAPVFEAFSPAELDRMTRLMERFSLSLLEPVERGNESCLRCGAYIADDCRVAVLRGGCPYQQACGSGTSEMAPQETP